MSFFNVTLAADDDRPFSAHKNNSKQKEKKICSENVEKSKEENSSSQVTLAADDVAQLPAHKKKVRFSDVKAYEWPNKRDIIKEPNDDSFEMKFNFMKKELVKKTEKYIIEHCDKKGNPKNRNLTRKQENSIKSLRKRTEIEKLAIYETDKTKKLVLDTLSNVKDKMEEHLVKDRVITPKEVTKHENVLNSQTKSWVEMLSIGSECGQKERTKSNLITEKNPLPLMRGTAKDHKVAADPKKGPKMRPIMGARVGPNTGLSQIGSKVLRSIIDDVKVRHDVKSTEEMLARIENYNESLKSQKSKKKMVLASLDIKNFYPSIDSKRGAQIAKLMWNRSDIVIENVNADELVWYISKYGQRENIKADGLSEFFVHQKEKENWEKGQ